MSPTRLTYPGVSRNSRILHSSARTSVLEIEQAGTGPSRRHIQGSKIAKRLLSVKYSLLQYSKIENFTKKKFPKNGPSGAPGPASASPWRAERGTLPKLSTFLSQLKGFVAKHQKIEGEKILLSEKNLTVPEKLKGGTLWDFPTSILSQNSKKIEGGTLWGKKSGKSLAVPKKIGRGDPLVSPGMVWYAGKRKNLFGSVR